MKRSIFLTLSLLYALSNVQAQKNDLTPRTLTQVLTLEINQQGGANGAGVAWQPILKKYYAAQAGNADFPLQVFDVKGIRLSDDDLKTGVDVRGFWYNPATKTIQMTTYDNAGWFEYKLDGKGIPIAKKKLPVETTQPDPQSVGIYNAANKQVYFYDYASVSLESHGFDGSTGMKKIKLYLGIQNKSDVLDEEQMDIKANYNDDAIIYTAIPHAEIGLLNFTSNQIELYDLSTGLMTRVLKLPDGAPNPELLNFSYCNGIYWLFDNKARVWHGYR